MKSFLCSRCGGMRFSLTDLEDGTVEARCPICDLKVRFRIIEETEEK